jgi:hypothetical protein
VRLGGTGKPVVAQPRAGQHGEGEEPPRVPVVADPQPPTAGQPGDRALRLPPMAAQPLRGLDPTAGDADLDAPAPSGSLGSGDDGRPCRRGPSRGGSAGRRQGCAPAGCRPPAPPTPGCRWCWPRSPAATAAGHRPQPPGAACIQAWPGRLGLRRCDPPRTARRLTESTLTRDQSSAPAAPSSSSSSSCSRWNTPAAAHSANRRQQVVTLPQPNSPTGSSAQGVEVRAMKMMAAIQARSGTVRARRRGCGRAAEGAGAGCAATAGRAAGGRPGWSWAGIIAPPSHPRFRNVL